MCYKYITDSRPEFCIFSPFLFAYFLHCFCCVDCADLALHHSSGRRMPLSASISLTSPPHRKQAAESVRRPTHTCTHTLTHRGGSARSRRKMCSIKCAPTGARVHMRYLCGAASGQPYSGARQININAPACSEAVAFRWVCLCGGSARACVRERLGLLYDCW